MHNLFPRYSSVSFRILEMISAAEVIRGFDPDPEAAVVTVGECRAVSNTAVSTAGMAPPNPTPEADPFPLPLPLPLPLTAPGVGIMLSVKVVVQKRRSEFLRYAVPRGECA